MLEFGESGGVTRRTIVENMNRVSLDRWYNCSALVLGKDLNYLLELNRSELFDFLSDVLVRSVRREYLKSALTNCLSTGQERPFDLPWWQKLSWSIVFAIILIVAFGGNVIVMWIVLAHRRMRTVTNYLLVNLSVADLMMSLLNCIFNFIFMLDSNWPFGVAYCTVNNFVANVTVASSVFTLVVISFDRYMAIMRPLKHHMSRRRTIVALILIWLASALLAMPCLLYSTTMTRRYTNGKSRITCYLSWPDGDYLSSKAEYIYNLVFLGVTYLLPMTMMAVCYTLMGRKLWGSKSIGEHTQYQKDSMKSKRKVVKMFIIVVTIFAVCWLPYHGFFIFLYHHKRFTGTSYVQHVYLSFYWLAMSNAMVNPIIYYWMNTRFRVYFQQIICKCYCMMGRSNVRSRQMQEMAALQRSDRGHSGFIFASTHDIIAWSNHLVALDNNDQSMTRTTTCFGRNLAVPSQGTGVINSPPSTVPGAHSPHHPEGFDPRPQEFMSGSGETAF